MVTTSLSNQLLSPAETGQLACFEYGATVTDLRHLGFGDFVARRLRAEHRTRHLRDDEAVEIPVPISRNSVEIASLVAVGGLALAIASGAGAYLRADTLKLPVPLRATHLGWSDPSLGTVTMIPSIRARYRVASGQAALALQPATLPDDIKQQIIDNWPRPATLFLLGEPATEINVKLGYAPQRGGGVQSIAGTRSYRLADLQTWTKSGAVLKGQPTA